MSDTTKQYTLTLTDADLAALRDIVRATDEHPLLLAKLYKVRAVKPAPEPEPFNPNTGDAALDEFMRAHHDPKYKPLPMPKGAPFPGESPRPLRVILEEAIDAAKRHGWPGHYSGNFAAPKTRRRS